MNRRSFFRNLAIGTAALPVVAKASVSGQSIQSSLWDWVCEFKHEHRDVRIDAGADAIEWMRECAFGIKDQPRGLLSFESSASGGRARFIIENYPHRIHSVDPVCVIEPIVREEKYGGVIFRPNPNWKFAKFEAAIGYSLTNNHVRVAIFDRESHAIVRIVEWIPMINQGIR